MSDPVIIWQWNGEAMVPTPRFAAIAGRTYNFNTDYRMTAVEERSMASHNHFFACITSAWRTLPEDIGADFPTMDHLRAFALIKTGFHNERTYVAASKREARELAAFIKPFDPFALVLTQGLVVRVYTAQSQSTKAPPEGMGRERFQESKVKVLDFCADLIGVTADELSRTTKEHAQ